MKREVSGIYNPHGEEKTPLTDSLPGSAKIFFKLNFIKKYLTQNSKI
jgi:hypothetical protein